jgi:hypothetical protein
MSSQWTKKKLFFFCAAAFAGACTPNFAAPSEVSDLRVLAVQAEPPEAQFDAQGNVQDVSLRILAVDPARDGFSSMTSSLCAVTDSRRCESGPHFDMPLATRKGGTEFSATVPGALMARVIAFAQSSDKLQGLGGIRVMFALSVEDGDPNGPVAADKILLYSPQGTTPNHNPAMTGLALSRDGQPAGSVAPGQTLQLQRGVTYGIRPLLAPGAREEYDTTDLRGNKVHLKEQPLYAFFTTPGAEFDRDTAYEPVDGVAPPDGLTRIDAIRTGSGTVWVVIRDGRGGESWIAIPWTAG